MHVWIVEYYSKLRGTVFFPEELRSALVQMVHGRPYCSCCVVDIESDVVVALKKKSGDLLG